MKRLLPHSPSKPVSVGMLLGLALLCAACGSPGQNAAPTTAITLSATQSPTATRTLDPVSQELATRYAQNDQTRTVQALTPSATVTLTRTPRATFTPEPSPTPTASTTPAAPLADSGPWLLLEQERYHQHAPQLTSLTRHYYTADADGGNLQQVRLPEPAEGNTWQALPNPQSRSLAFLQVPRPGYPFSWNLQRERYEPYLWIAGLPENNIIRQIPLLGPQGWEQVAREQERIANTVEIPLTLGLVSDPRSLLWSPDGSRLAFSSGTRGSGADIFLYDAADDSLRGITNLNKIGAQPWFWSADGSWLVYRTGRRYTADGMGRFSNVWALSMEPGSRPKKLYSPRTDERVLGVTVLGFVMHEQAPESDPCHLRRVDFHSGQSQLLYRGCFAQAAAEPGGALLLNLRQGQEAAQPRLPAGIYRLDARTRALTLLTAGDYLLQPWDAQRRAFLAYRPEGGDPLVFRVDASGTLLEIAYTQMEHPSPDRRWLVRQTQQSQGDPDGLLVLNAAGQPVADLGGMARHKLRWRPDSSGFYVLSCIDGCLLSLHRRERGWQAEWLFPRLNPPNEMATLRMFWLIAPP